MDDSLAYADLSGPTRTFMEHRARDLLRRALEVPLPSKDQGIPEATLLLETALEAIQVAEEELRSEQEAWQATRIEVEAEGVRYRKLFEFAPGGYLVTDRAGLIHDANREAARILRRLPERLRGKPLAAFVASAERPAFRTALNRVAHGQTLHEWPVALDLGGGEQVDVRLSLSVVSAGHEGSDSLCWLIQRDSAGVEADLL